MADLAFRPLSSSDEDLTRFVACFEANGDTKSLRHLRWQFRELPTPGTFIDVAEEASGRLGGIYAVFPVKMRLGDRVVVGVQSLDTLTDANHRGKGLFTKLAQRVYDRCAADGVALVYGFPNGNSAHGFFERLAWTRLDPVPFLIRPLRLKYALGRAKVPSSWLGPLPEVGLGPWRPPRLAADEEIVVTPEIDASLAAVWPRFAAAGIGVAVERDLAYLRWRLRRPGTTYKILAFRRAGAVLGWCATTVADKHGGRVGYVMELLHDPDAPQVGAALARAALRELSAAGADVALAWCLGHSPNHAAYRSVGFRTLPERLRPIELHFGVRAFGPSGVATGNRENWYLSYLDSDTV